MSLILGTIESIFYYLIKYSLISVILWISVYYVISLIGKLLFRSIRSDGKAVLITGCDSGFGNRLAQRLCKMGFRVYATVLSPTSKGAEQLKTEFADKAVILQMNVTNDTEVNETYETVKKDLENSGHVLWAMVNNAGIYIPGPLDWGSMKTFKQTFDINLFGTVRVTRVFLPLIRASKGRITNVASLAGRASYFPHGLYSMSKYSTVAFTETLRLEMNKFGVNVSSIEPSFFNTSLIDSELFKKQAENCWNQSSDQVKKSYGKPGAHIRQIVASPNIFPRYKSIEIVIDCMIDSIVSARPHPIYRPMPIVMKPIPYINLFLPKLADWIYETLCNFNKDVEETQMINQTSRSGQF